MTDDTNHNSHDDPPAHNDPDKRRQFMQLVGFTADEILAIEAEQLSSPMLAFSAIARVAERVEAMEVYLRAKIKADRERSGRIIKPSGQLM